MTTYGERERWSHIRAEQLQDKTGLGGMYHLDLFDVALKDAMAFADAHPVTTRQEDGAGKTESLVPTQQASDAPAPSSVVEALRDLLDTLGDPEEYDGHIIVEIYKASAALDALPEVVVDGVWEVSQLGFCSARLRELGLASGDRLRVVVWREWV